MRRRWGFEGVGLDNVKGFYSRGKELLGYTLNIYKNRQGILFCFLRAECLQEDIKKTGLKPSRGMAHLNL